MLKNILFGHILTKLRITHYQSKDCIKNTQSVKYCKLFSNKEQPFKNPIKKL